MGNYSDVARDPRGRVISCAYTAVVDRDQVEVQSGDDAVDADWFAVKVTGGGEVYEIRLNSPDKELSAKLRRTENGTEILADSGLAFDHAKIILDAYLKALQ